MNTKLNDACFEKSCSLTKRAIKSLYAFFTDTLNKPGFTKAFSLLTLDNIIVLDYACRVIDESNPDVTRTKEYKDCEAEMSKLLDQFGDRDSQGKLKRDENGNVIIGEQLLEFNEAKAKFDAAHTTIMERLENNNVMIDAFLNEEMTITLVLFNKFGDYPDNLPPSIISILEKLY